jgi:DNA invertase Pin-like site-specific DNA recombinase
MTTPAVIYGVKSSPDEKESVTDQHRQVLAAMPDDRFLVAEPFGESNRSGYRKERGPQLEVAMRTAIEAAAEHGEAELWVFHSSRLARGDGRKGRRSLMKIYADLLYENVQIRSATDDEFVRNGMLVGVASDQNSKYSKDLSDHVRRGQRQVAEKGGNPRGPLPDGYAPEYWVDEKGKRHRRIVLHAEREGVVRGILDESRKGAPDTAIARSLNARGVTTRQGNPWSRRTVQNLVLNPFYAGRIHWQGEVYEGSHPRLIEPRDFDRMVAARDSRDLGRGRHVKGRPAKRHALQRLAVCGACGRRMVSWTSPYKRKDGSKQRTYRCPGYHEQNDSCSATHYDAEEIDRHVLSALDSLLPDFEAWIAQVTERQSGERERLDAELESVEADRDEQAKRTDAVEAKWADYVAAGDDAKADLVVKAIERERTELDRRAKLVSATRAALDATPAEAPTDSLLDFAASLQKAVRGIDTTGSMAQVNAALSEIFEGFAIYPACRNASSTGPDVIPVTIEPVLHSGVAWAILFENAPTTGRMSLPFEVGDEVPPMGWLASSYRNSDHSQEYLLMNPKRSALAASHA